MKPVTDPSLIEQLNSGSQGMKPVQDPALLAQLNGEQPEQDRPSKWDAFKQGVGMVKDAVVGNDEFQDAGNIQDYINTTDRFGLNKQGFSLAASSMFGNTDDVINTFKKYNPDTPILRDKTNGNPYIEKDGKKFYFNKDGIDLGDAVDTVGNAGTYIAGGLATAPIKSVGTRMAATYGVEGGINGINQALAGRDDIDQTEMALAGATGAAFEGLTPIVSAAWRWAKNSAKSNLEAGQAIAKVKELDLKPEQIEQLGQMVRNLDPDQVDVDTIIQHIELGQTPTRGTITKDKHLIDAENKMRDSGRKSVQDKFADLDEANQRGLSDSIKNMGGVKAVDDYDAADSILSNVQKSESNARQAVNNAYDDVGGAFAKTDSIKELPKSLRKTLSDNAVILDPDNVPKTNVAIRDIENSIQKMGEAKGVSWQAVDQQRKKLNGLFSGASSEDKRALTLVKKQYDDVVHNAFENDLLSGDKDTITKVQKARGLATDYFKKYQKNGTKDTAGAVIDDWINNPNINPENVADGIINIHGNFNKKSYPMIQRLKEIAGDDSEQIQAVRDLVLQRMTRKLGEPKTREALRSSLRKSLKGQKTIFDALYSKKEIGFLSRGLQYLDSTSLDGVKARSSGTAERLNRWANMSVGDDLSMSGVLNTFKKALGMLTGGEGRALRLPKAQIQANPLTGTGVAIQNQTSGQ